ncbi:MAG: hypothetical protein KA229_13225 [Chitinophagaceae bacterium]|nr:hypothetical protein [Chitinophagaceae bacterium]
MKIKINIPGLTGLLLLLAFAISCRQHKATAIERDCPCDSLYHREVKGKYLQFHQYQDSTPYTGYCHLSRDNGNTIRYHYESGLLTEQIEKYPSGFICEITLYDTSGTFNKRENYHPNGQLAGRMLVRSDHGYESFYPNGNIQRKGGFSLLKKPFDRRDSTFYEEILFDSIWKSNGSFDSVYRYSPASVTY